VRKVIIFSILVLICAYLGWYFYSSRTAKRELERKAAQETGKVDEQEAVEQRALLKAYGGSRVKVADFYVVPAVIHPGQKAKLCYSVVNADKVWIEPPVGDVWPSFSRCVDVSPKKDTLYKITAEEETGQSQTQSVTLKVQ
jgi:hypothetical protein